MKKSMIIIFLLITNVSFGQNKQQDFEKKLFIELNNRTSFYEVTDRYQVIKDTIFHANTGFKIYPEYDIVKIDNIEYVILRYPIYKNGKQSCRTKDYEIVKTLKEQEPVHFEITGVNGKILAIKKSEFDLVDKELYYSIGLKNPKNYKLSFGFLTVPFKFRPSLDTINSNITTDVTLGPYLGITKRISARNRYYITLPATLGLSYINLNNNNTSNLVKDADINVVPGISWCSGLIFQLSDFNVGFVFGQDFASGIGDKWVYNGKMWYSFAIGYSFLKDK